MWDVSVFDRFISCSSTCLNWMHNDNVNHDVSSVLGVKSFNMLSLALIKRNGMQCCRFIIQCAEKIYCTIVDICIYTTICTRRPFWFLCLFVRHPSYLCWHVIGDAIGNVVNLNFLCCCYIKSSEVVVYSYIIVDPIPL